MTDTKKMSVGIYARVSTDSQDTDNQLAQPREFADRQGWAIAMEYGDTVTGSGRKARPQFEAMMLAASQRQFDLLLFWKLDGSSREGVRKTLVHLTRLDSYGCRLAQLHGTVLRFVRDHARSGYFDHGHVGRAGTHRHQ